MAFPFDVDGTWTNGPTFDAGEMRRADAALIASAGVASGLNVTVDGSDVVTVTAGQVVISGEDAVTGTGVYRAGLGASATGSLTARNATNPRIDLVVFRYMDTDVVPAHAAKTGRIEIIAGTPSATPVVPTRPSMAVELARITVPNSGGGAATVNSSNRVAARAIGAPKVAAGVAVPTMASGTVSVTLSASGTGTGTITYPAGLFTTAPLVFLTPTSSSIVLASSSAKSTSGCTVTLRHYDNASTSATISVDWLAIG